MIGTFNSFLCIHTAQAIEAGNMVDDAADAEEAAAAEEVAMHSNHSAKNQKTGKAAGGKAPFKPATKSIGIQVSCQMVSGVFIGLSIGSASLLVS